MIVTGSRGEYGYIKPIIHKLTMDKDLSFEIVATNMHLLPEFGLSESELIKDGIPIHYRIYNTIAGYNTVTMTKSLGLFLIQFPEIVLQSRPDIILISGDRGEMLMAAIAGAHMNTLVAHIQAGEVTGNVDGNIRHAITKLSHVHFASNVDAYDRVIKMGEQDFRVFNVGAPLVDDIVSYIERDDLPNVRDIYNLDRNKKIVLLVWHPVTEEFEMVYQYSAAVMSAINDLSVDEFQIIVIAPNSDAGCLSVRNALKQKTQLNYRIFDNLPRSEYISFMRESSIIVGNSSSGIMEAPSLKIPCVNIGNRQKGRMQGSNVINSGYERKEIYNAIIQALDPSFKSSIQSLNNPYGDGRSAERIIEVLKNIDINESLVNKRMAY